MTDFFINIKNWFIDVKQYFSELKEEKQDVNNKLEIIKVVREWFSNRYKTFVEDIFAEKFSQEEILKYLQKEDSISSALNRIKQREEESVKIEAYNSVIKNKKGLKQDLLDGCKNNFNIYQEELNRIKDWHPSSQKEIKIKNKKIKQLETKINEVELLMKTLLNIKFTTKPKKVGRPTQAEVEQKQLKEFMENDEEVTLNDEN